MNRILYSRNTKPLTTFDAPFFGHVLLQAGMRVTNYIAANHIQITSMDPYTCKFVVAERRWI